MVAKKNMFLISFLVCSSQLVIAEPISNFKASAKIEKVCSISVGDINFGVVNSPLTEQNASSEMKVLCSNEALYTIDLRYGVTSGNTSSNFKVELHSYYDSSSSGYMTNYYKVNGKFEGGALYCKKDGTLWFSANQQIIDLNLKDLRTNEAKVCNSDGTINIKNTENLFNNNVNLDYGTMNGVSSKDLMAYKFTLPNDSSKVWKLNYNSFNSIGNGEMQTIIINAKILPENSSSKYLAQDTYIDSVIAEISY